MRRDRHYVRREDGTATDVVLFTNASDTVRFRVTVVEREEDGGIYFTLETFLLAVGGGDNWTVQQEARELDFS